MLVYMFFDSCLRDKSVQQAQELGITCTLQDDNILEEIQALFATVARHALNPHSSSLCQR